MRFAVLLFLGCAALASANAWAINKCTGPDGKVVFQDLPCAGQGEQMLIKIAKEATWHAR
ncbi:DUF4124 domain-containing protein [Comamonas sp. NLF-1-9]|uniref:DUF4124 domain-containing protein n=1 Tax=Comamonas sp. NLF-1-9 TaxID=2853163 RepID=UPI00210832A2|nr:DUF4124 domain-containing protein [Comamonas sp. NLF-1-9]